MRLVRHTAHPPGLRLGIGRSDYLNGPVGRNCVGLSDQDEYVVRDAMPCDEARVWIAAWPIALKGYKRVGAVDDERDGAVCVAVCSFGQYVRGAEEIAVAEERIGISIVFDSVVVPVVGIDTAADGLDAVRTHHEVACAEKLYLRTDRRVRVAAKEEVFPC